VPELFPIGLPEQIACVEREIALRHRVYPRRVADRKMTQALADKQIAAMSAVLETLLFVRALRQMGEGLT
jgi:hypothetical protein